MSKRVNNMNDLNGKEWLRNSFSIWRDLDKTKEEKELKHPALYPVSLCEKLIRTFSNQGEYVVDPFNGVGTTTKACSNLGWRGLGIELSKEFCEIARSRLTNSKNVQIINGDSNQVLKEVSDSTFDLCVTSPPYWNILNRKRSADRKENNGYTDSNKDLGNIEEYEVFLNSLKSIFEQIYRVLKNDSYCLINVMDIRKKSNFYPLHIDVARFMKEIGFIFDDLIIWDRQKEYNNMRPLGYPYRFRINKVHEYILIFLKE